MAIQVRRGNEADFDASKMLPGEWAVSLDTKYVRMCFAPGIVLRMATYEGFEADKAQFQAILAECRSIQEVVRRIGNEVSEKASLTIEYSNSAKESAERAKIYADNAEAVTGVHIATKDRAGLVKGGDNYIAEDGTLTLIKQTAETTMPNSYDGRLLVEEIGGGESQQFTTSGKNLLDCSGLTEQTKNGITFTPVYENGMLQYINVNGTATANADYTIKYMDFVANTEYAINGCPSGGSSDTYFFAINGTTASQFDVGSGNTFTFNSEKNTNALIRIRAGITVSNLKFYPMVRLASVTDATYESYTGGIPSPNPSYPQEIKKTVVSEIRTHGEQLLDISGLTEKTVQGITFTPQPDGGIKVKGTATAQADFYLVGSLSSPHAIEGVEENSKIFIGYKSDPKICYIRYLSGTVSTNIVKNSEVSYATSCKILLRVTTGGVVDETLYVMVSKTDTPWKPYTESVITLSQPIELYGIGDVQDVITPKEIKRRYCVKVLNGSEGWRHNAVSWQGEPYNTFSFIIEDFKFYDNNAVNYMCASYRAISVNSRYQNYTFFVNSLKDFTFTTPISTLEEWKAHLQANPITVVYEMAEEVIEELPLADQIALNSLQTYDGITYLEIDSEIEPTFKGEYGTSKVGGYALEGMLAGRNGELYGKDYNSRLSALETSVVNNI